MFTISDENSKDNLRRWVNGYLAVSAAVLIFAAIYEHFSHEVYSTFMLGACLIPLALGAAPLEIIRRKARLLPGNMMLQIHGCSIAALTAGSVFKGVLEIYGTTNSLALVYPILGGMLLMTVSVLYAAGMKAFAKR